MKIYQTQPYNNYSKNNTPIYKQQNITPSFGDLKAPPKVTAFIHDNFTVPVMKAGTKVFKDPNDNLLNHMQAIGSALVSGVYMYRTVHNDNLDETKKKTLAVNQFFTFVASTIISYMLDGMLNNFSEKISYNYANKKIEKAIELTNKDSIFTNAQKELERARKNHESSTEFLNKLKKAKDSEAVQQNLAAFREELAKTESNKHEIKALDELIESIKTDTDLKFKDLKKAVKSGVTDKILKPSNASGFVSNYIETISKNKSIANPEKYTEFFKTLSTNLVGVGVLKKLLIFTMIYRFVSPIAVTPLANMVGNKIFEKKNQK